MHSALLRGLAVSVAAAATLTVVNATASAAPAAGEAERAGVVSGAATLTEDAARLAGDSDAAIGAYWTPERMKEAKSLDTVRQLAPGTKLPSREEAARNAGTPGSVAPTGDAGVNQVQPVHYPAYPANHPTARTNGKVFFVNPNNGLKYVCSAAVVNSEGRSTVWTAGHCLTSNQKWMQNWTFIPAYKNGNKPFGNWYAKNLWTLTAFYNNNTDWSNDIGAVIMKPKAGVKIVNKFGGQGLKWNAPLSYVHAFGYPHAAPFNGQRLYHEEGNRAFYGPDQYMTNIMTGGSSGGPWLDSFDGRWGYINGHNDYKYSNWPNLMFSPYYGDQAALLYNAVRHLS